MSKEDIAVFFYFEKNIKLLNPKKLKYEKNKVCASIIFTFCRLTNIPELKIASPDELSTIIQL